VLTQLWSEFGRRPKENGSGTDHGAGGVAFLIGTRAAGKMVGEFPALASSTKTKTWSGPQTSARCTARCWSSGFRRKPARDPEAASFERPVLVA